MKLFLLTILSTCIFISCNGQAKPTVTTPGTSAQDMDKNTWIVFQDSKSNYWFGSDGAGAFRYDGKTLRNFSRKHGLPSDQVREIQEDRQGNIYINTLEGISKFDGKKFTTLAAKQENNWKLQPNDLWFKGPHGPLRYDGKNLYALRFPKHGREDELLEQNNNIDPQEVYCIYKDRKNNMWFGTGGAGLYRYDGNNIANLYEEHLTNTPGGGSFGIRSIIEDRNGQFWFCNTKYRYNILPGVSEKGKGFINYTKENGPTVTNNDLGGDRMYFQSAAEDSKGNLWFQTYRGGIWEYDREHLTHYPIKDGKEIANVIALYQDNNGVLWLGTNGSGVYKFDGKEFVKFKP